MMNQKVQNGPGALRPEETKQLSYQIMGSWFYNFIPYLVLDVFHFTTVTTENPGLTAPVPEEVPETWPAFYHPPRAPFGLLHFSDYNLKPEYKEFTLDIILRFNCLDHQRTLMLCLAPGDNIQEDTAENLYNKRFEV
ncbi:hypothetical protein DSO57_1007401 [Entomophthora muscae]|uniref:Uncharacterized protein n=1 Tax=Entomophthora muscae TaxID=34485 RepID=A0ACC2TV63_9FUNG|nr:hypothetical protein DSO57_1007401 [Entomophthora muscae]